MTACRPPRTVEARSRRQAAELSFNRLLGRSRRPGDPLRTRDAVEERGPSDDFNAASQLLAQPQRHPDRRRVLRVDQADDLRLHHVREREVEGRASALGGIASPPELPPQDPAELEAGPTVGIPEPDPPDELAGA